MASGWKPYDRSRPRDRSPSRDKRLPHTSLTHRSPPRRGPTRSVSPIKNSRDSKYVEAERSDRGRRYDNEDYTGERVRDRNHERVSHRDWSRTSERNPDRGDQRRERPRDRRQEWERPVDRGRQRDEDRMDGWTYSRDEEHFEEVGSQQAGYYDLDQEEHERDQRESRRLDYSERDNRRSNGRSKPMNGNKSYQSTSRTESTRQSKGNYHRPTNSNDQKSNIRQKYETFRPSTYENKRTYTSHRNGRSRSRSPPRRQPTSHDLDTQDLEGARRKKRRLDSSREQHGSRTRTTNHVRETSRSRSWTRSISRTGTPTSPRPRSRSHSRSQYSLSPSRPRSPSPLPPQPPRPPRRARRSVSREASLRGKSPTSDHSRSSYVHPPLPPRKPFRLATSTLRSPSSKSSIDGRPCKAPSRPSRRDPSPSGSVRSRNWDTVDSRLARGRSNSPSSHHDHPRGRRPESRNSIATPSSRHSRSSSTSRPHRRHSSTSRERISSSASPARLQISGRDSLEAELGPPPMPPKPPIGPRSAQNDLSFRRGHPTHGKNLVTMTDQQSRGLEISDVTSNQAYNNTRHWDDQMQNVPKGPRSTQAWSTNGARHQSSRTPHPSAPSDPVNDQPQAPIRIPPRPTTPQPPPPPPPPLPPPQALTSNTNGKRPTSPRRIKSTVNPLRPPGMPPVAPVAQTSAGVRRFFPGDDDDDDDLNGAAIEAPSKLWHPVDNEKHDMKSNDTRSPRPVSPPPRPPTPPAVHISPDRFVSPEPPTRRSSRRRSKSPLVPTEPRAHSTHRAQDPRLQFSDRSRHRYDYNQPAHRERPSRWSSRRNDSHTLAHEQESSSPRYTNGPTSDPRMSRSGSEWDAPPPPPPLPVSSTSDSASLEPRKQIIPSPSRDETRPHNSSCLTSPSAYAASGSQVFGNSLHPQEASVEAPFDPTSPRVPFPSHPSVLYPQNGSSAWPNGQVPVPPSRPVTKDVYERIVQVGEGTYGKVYKARNVENGRLVAMKRIRMEAEKDGFPITAIREIKLLQGLRHPNIVNLVEMVVSKGHVYIVFEYMDHDLSGLLHHPNIHFSESNIKSLMWQLLSGLRYMHEAGVLHRDLKGSNILLNRLGELKIADFGLARRYERGKEPGQEGRGRGRDYTNRVITLWYKPPELLFGATVYGEEVDMWSAGAIFLELFTRRPIFQANDEIDQLQATFKLMGTPCKSNWPEVINLPWYELVKPKIECESSLRKKFFDESDQAKEKVMKSEGGMRLAEGLLQMNPIKRPSAKDAMKFEYFLNEEPVMELPTRLLSSLKGEWHELESKRARKQRREG